MSPCSCCWLLVASLLAKSSFGSQLFVAGYVSTLRMLNVQTLGIVRPKLLIALDLMLTWTGRTLHAWIYGLIRSI